ncbi:MAG TPA: hypothetical protein VKM72_22060 [Thermoanaerobaculia bacterium]|nr:hypothetical protein [Thermoanaerobaculia bacterium]
MYGNTGRIILADLGRAIRATGLRPLTVPQIERAPHTRRLVMGVS